MTADPLHPLRQSDARRLARLLDDEPAGTSWRPDELEAVLRHQLAAPLEAGSASFAELLRQPGPPAEMLEISRAFAKSAMTRPDSGLPREVAAVLYYASILLSRLRHGLRISQLDDAELARAVEWR